MFTYSVMSRRLAFTKGRQWIERFSILCVCLGMFVFLPIQFQFKSFWRGGARVTRRVVVIPSTQVHSELNRLLQLHTQFLRKTFVQRLVVPLNMLVSLEQCPKTVGVLFIHYFLTQPRRTVVMTCKPREKNYRRNTCST